MPRLRLADPNTPRHSNSARTAARRSPGRATAEALHARFFAEHTVTELASWNDYELEMAGGSTHPMGYDAATDRYLPVEWSDAFAMIGATWMRCPIRTWRSSTPPGAPRTKPPSSTSCSCASTAPTTFPTARTCATRRPASACRSRSASARAPCSLEDFDKADCIFIFGQNPGTNSPRMMTSLRDAARRGARSSSFNPFRERALERFQAIRRSPLEMVDAGVDADQLALFQVRVGGDVAVLKGIDEDPGGGGRRGRAPSGRRSSTGISFASTPPAFEALIERPASATDGTTSSASPA